MRKKRRKSTRIACFFSYFVITTTHSLNLIKNIMLVTFLQTKIENRKQFRQKAEVLRQRRIYLSQVLKKEKKEKIIRRFQSFLTLASQYSKSRMTPPAVISICGLKSSNKPNASRTSIFLYTQRAKYTVEGIRRTF